LFKISNCGTSSGVSIATAYELDGRGWNSCGARFFAPAQTGLEDHTASSTGGTGFSPGVSCGQGVTLAPHPLLVPRSKI